MQGSRPRPSQPPSRSADRFGTALLSTIAASALTNYITSAHTHPTRLLLAHAALHGDTTAFAWAAVIFAAGAVIAATLFEHGTKALGIKATAAPATAS